VAGGSEHSDADVEGCNNQATVDVDVPNNQAAHEQLEGDVGFKTSKRQKKGKKA